MLRIFVVDRSAESRQAITAHIRDLAQRLPEPFIHLPPLDVRALACEEVAFHKAPAVCFVGEEIWRSDPSELARFKRQLPDSVIVAYFMSGVPNVALVERLALYGADDVLSQTMRADAFVERLVILKNRLPCKRRGRMIVCDSAKGGVGVTSIAAAFAELACADRHVVLADLDLEGQALSRYLISRSRDSGTLSRILNGERLLNRETLAQILCPIDKISRSLMLLPPPRSESCRAIMRDDEIRSFLAVFEAILADWDLLIIDAAHTQGDLLANLYRIADKIVFVINNDPATVYPSLSKLSRYEGLINDLGRLTVVQNGEFAGALGQRQLRHELLAVLDTKRVGFSERTIPFSPRGSGWPGSGRSMAQLAESRFRRLLVEIAVDLEICREPPSRSSRWNRFRAGWSGAAREAAKQENAPGLPAPGSAMGPADGGDCRSFIEVRHAEQFVT